MTSLRQRVLAAFGASALSQVANIGMQLLSLPIFLSQWDATTYGVWLLLSSLPAYLSMADVGVVTAAGNRITMDIARKRTSEANAHFQSAFLFVSSAAVLIVVVCIPIGLWAPLPGLTSIDRRTALLALSAVVVAGLFGGLAETIFKATGRYATSIHIGTGMRVSEWLGSIFGLLYSGSLAAVALSALVVRIIGLVVCISIANRASAGLEWGYRRASLVEIKTMLRPASSFMAFPLANGLSLQGLTLLVGHLFGPAAVAMFNTYRTLARSSIQLTSMLSHALWPEFSRLFGEGAGDALGRVYRRSAKVCGLGALLLSCALVPVAPHLIEWWTHGVIGYSPWLMILLLGYAAAGGAGHVPRVMLMATNLHQQIALWSLAAAIATLLIAALLSSSMGLAAAGLAMLVTEAALTIACVAFVRRLLGGPWQARSA